ncbi:MAG TPA: preprotein translocase subunit YajC [Tissierellaceae bacterium]|nr:preprotein translocase subunit YajC [Tissierellaceae bacterium]
MDAQQLQGLLLPVGMIAIFYFFAIRPQKKKEKEINEMRSQLSVGDEVITIGGILAKIITVKEDQVIVEVGTTKTRLELTKWAIGSVVKREE